MKITKIIVSYKRQLKITRLAYSKMDQIKWENWSSNSGTSYKLRVNSMYLDRHDRLNTGRYSIKLQNYATRYSRSYDRKLTEMEQALRNNKKYFETNFSKS